MHEVSLFLHVLGAAVLFSTGMGIAFFMLMAHHTGDLALIAHTAGMVVFADPIFTATAVIAQPITGTLLALSAGWSIFEGWILAALILYVLTSVFWSPVVWIQIRLRNLAHAADAAGGALPDQYHRLFRIWLLCGFPAFGAVLAAFWLMLIKPDFGF